MSAPCPLFGFTVTISPPSQPIAEALRLFSERHGLVAEVRSATQVVITADGTQATDADRALVREWAEHHYAATTFDLSELVDLR